MSSHRLAGDNTVAPMEVEMDFEREYRLGERIK